MRERTRGGFQALEYQGYQKASDCSESNWTGSIADANGEHTIMHDVVTPNFYSRIKRGEVIVNPMNRVTTKRSSSGTTGAYQAPASPCTQVLSHSDGMRILHPNYLGLMGHARTDLDDSSGYHTAATAAWANVGSPDFDGSTFIAELGDLLRLLANPIRGFQKAVQRAQKRAKRNHVTQRSRAASGALTVFDHISSGWLTYRYGIMPTVYDAEEFCEAIDKLADKPERFIARGRGNSGANRTRVETGRAGYWDLERVINTAIQVNYRAGILYEMDHKSSFGLRWSDVPGAAWEVVPFSFVVDWFTNVGDFVRAITPKPGVNVLGKWMVEERTITSEGITTSVWNPPSGSAATSISDPTATETLVSDVKKRSVGLPSPSLAADFSPFEGDLGQKRILDSLALTFQILGTKIR